MTSCKLILISTIDSIINSIKSSDKQIILEDLEVRGINAGHKFDRFLTSHRILLENW